MLWLVALLNYMDRLLITTMRDPIMHSIPMSDAQFGLLTAVFLWVYAGFSPLGGFLADRFSRSKMIIASLLVWSLVTWLTGHARNFEELLIARMLMGLSEACYIPAALALIADYHRGSTRSLATGLHMSGIYMGAALGGLGGVMAESLGWRSAFGVFGVVGIVYALVLLLGLRDAPSAERKDVSDASDRKKVSLPSIMHSLLSTPAFLVLLAINVLYGAANWSIYGWLPTFLKDHFHLGLGAAGMSATGYAQAASFFGVLIGGAWADRWIRRNPNARALVPAIGFVFAAPFLFLSATTDALPFAIAGLIVYGLARGFFDSNHMPVLRSCTNEKYSATGYGILNLVSCAAGGGMIYAGGAMKDAGMSLGAVFQISSAAILIIGLLLFFLRARSVPPAHV